MSRKYFVYSPLKEKPTYLHKTYDEALQEAERLALKEDCNFLILKVVAVARSVRTVVINELLEESEEIENGANG